MDAYRYDLFVSYATEPDARLTRKLEHFLEAFHHLETPKELTLRQLNICRDGSDFSLASLRSSSVPDQDAVTVLIREYLQQSRQLLVICSGAARDSDWVDVEIRWFLENRGADNIFLAISEGTDPGSDPRELFSATVIEAGLHRKPWYDFRNFKNRKARDWVKVKPFDDEMVRLAADLNGMSAGEIQPVWFREQLRSKRRQMMAVGIAAFFIVLGAGAAWYQQTVARQEQGLKLVALAYELLYRDPSAALLKAYRASELVPGAASATAITAAYKATVLHHGNRRETAQISGSGPNYLAGRWKQGEIFASPSPDGRYRLLVTERGQDGANPPGDVYLVNNESLRTTQLASCAEDNRRVEAVGFDRSSSRVFVSRQYNVNIYTLNGRCAALIRMSCCTKSPVHLIDGMLADRYAIVAETKGGLWLTDVDDPDRQPLVLLPEFHGDAAVTMALSPDRRQALVVFESGRVGLIGWSDDAKPVLRDVVKKGALFAAFDPAGNNQVLTAGRDGVLRRFEMGVAGAVEIGEYKIADTAIDFVSFSDDSKELLAVGDNQTMYVVDHDSGHVLRAIREDEGIDWAATRVVAVKPEVILPERGGALPALPLTDPSVAGARAMTVAGHQWLVTETSADYGKAYVTFRVNSDEGIAYAVVAQDVQTIEQYGDLVWLKSRPVLQDGLSGRVVRFDGNEAIYYPSKDIEVSAVATFGGKLYLATGHGLFTIEGSTLKRISRATLEVRGLYPMGERLWVATNQGGYLVEKDLLYRLTDPFAQIRAVKEVGGRVWMLTKSSAGNLSANFGPAYLVDGYLSRPYPNPEAQIADVVWAAGKTWLAGSPGLYVLAASQALPVGNIPEVVNAIDELPTGVRVSTEIHSWPFVNSGPQYDVDASSLAVRKR